MKDFLDDKLLNLLIKLNKKLEVEANEPRRKLILKCRKRLQKDRTAITLGHSILVPNLNTMFAEKLINN